MSNRRLHAAMQPIWLLVLLCSGCAPDSPWRFIYPEERTLHIREVGQLPKAPLADVPAPLTVSDPTPVPDPKRPASLPKELTLDEAIHIALANTKAIRVLNGVSAVGSGQTIYDAAISSTTIDEARAVFDPTLAIKNTFNRQEPPTAVLNPADPRGAQIPFFHDDQYDFNLSLTKKTAIGGTFGLTFDVNRSQFTRGFAPLNPQVQSSVLLSYTQPLLRGAGLAANMAPIMIARLNTEVSFFQYKDAVQEQVRGVVEAYWAVVFARTDRWAKHRQVELGQENYEIAAAKLRFGLGNAGQAAQTKAALYNFKAALVAADANVLAREAALRNILYLPPNEPEQLTLITPLNPVRVEPRWDEILKLAGERRPDLIELGLVIEADQQSLALANNQARPQIDMVSFYRWNGLEGETPSGARIATTAGQFGDWTVGVNFSVPLGLRQDRARLRRSELTLVRDHANLEQAMHSAIHILAGNVRNLSQYYELYRAYREARAAARANLDQQLADFKTRGAIYLNVLQAINDWGNAVSSEAQALAQYNIELASLERQTGTILETHGVRFAEERFQAIGPLGRCALPKLYPAAMPPTPNQPIYPVGTEPAEKALDREFPSRLQKGPAPELPELPRPKFLAPTPN